MKLDEYRAKLFENCSKFFEMLDEAVEYIKQIDSIQQTVLCEFKTSEIVISVLDNIKLVIYLSFDRLMNLEEIHECLNFHSDCCDSPESCVDYHLSISDARVSIEEYGRLQDYFEDFLIQRFQNYITLTDLIKSYIEYVASIQG